ncbi:DNA polymerase III subunit gamma and tau [Nocardioides sp. Soil805]|uniref:DNA polymerase III subunit gamma and tau n=1 Tax=Nocardioides sp. Soil805 TaxID=1736416 RepID=UPI000702C975|nr:DNA polymerase III subunit gamma and tau [Nocardioides sp. Soil805]KRF37334.1 DNA polymerase III subunit gamma/tau [Nocardioides sp. Soil805]
MESPLALYRRYRPETFAEVIGQDHVTEPLRVALANDRVNHAYLFSGPRGCGKTTSARILARSLNCAQAPVADPCGECDSCRELARGGSGSIDVIEIDAASHGGVDDARDLREKAFFSPVRDRYKIYIIDEAHMVSPQGFNALLKLVEEPPPHLRFIFATTEPEKVLPTIRSRTHHYPFRLIPPRLLSDYLSRLCEEEGVAIEPAALPLVVRAGGGSARDTLSVLDQLLGGAGPTGVTHALATALLGFTPDALLDEVVDAFAAGDGAAVFGVVDKVVETGQDPRRFTEDLLRRLRDLVIVAAVPEAPASGLIDVAEDAGERLVAQAARFGALELSRAADIVAAGLTEMRGATAPRLLLELICARVLLPGADHTNDGVMARLDRLERRLDVSGAVSAAPSAGAPAARAVAPRPAATRPEPVLAAPAPAEVPVDVPQQAAPQMAPGEVPADPAPAPASAPRPPADAPVAAAEDVPPTTSASQAPAAPGSPDDEPVASREAEPAWPAVTAPPTAPGQPPVATQEAPTPDAATPAAAPGGAVAAPSAGDDGQASGPQGGLSMVEVRRLWPDIVDATKMRRRLAWMILTQNAQVVGVDSRTLTVGFASHGARESFVGGGCDEILRQAAIDVVGVDWRIDAIVDPSAAGGSGQPVVTTPAAWSAPASPAPSAMPDERAPVDSPPDWVTGGAAGEPAAPAAPPEAARPPQDSAGLLAAREALERSRTAPSSDEPRVDHAALADAAADPDDPDADTQGLDSTALLQQTLGAKVIDEIRHT